MQQTASEFIGSTVTFLAALAAFFAVGSRSLTDWAYRRLRDPTYLRELGEERRQLQEWRDWQLWRATMLGGAAGVVSGALAMTVDAI